MLTGFQNSFTVTVISRFVMKTPPYVKHVATKLAKYLAPLLPKMADGPVFLCHAVRQERHYCMLTP